MFGTCSLFYVAFLPSVQEVTESEAGPDVNETASTAK